VNKLLIIVLFCTLFSCSKAEKEIFNLHGGRIFVIGHGGAGFETAFNYLPENSLGSIERCIVALSSDGVEVDVQLTQDNELVLYHDNRLETQTNCLGCIRAKNFNEVLECRFTKNFVTAVLTEEKIISLRSILERYSSRNPRPKIFLDVRLFDECYDFSDFDSLIDIYTQSILNLIVEFNYHQEIYVESASVQFLKRMQDKAPGLKYLVDSSFFESTLDSVIANNFYGIVIENKKISREQVKIAHDHNVNVVIFNTRSRNSNLEAVNKHPDYIQTDEIILLQQILMNK
jgi:glycerophosphoryl diester phosphodiesterase